jgi:hypothetical protein
MSESNQDGADRPASRETAPLMGPDEARAALVDRLSKMPRKATCAKSDQSLQPTPEAAKSRTARIRRKQLLLRKSKRALLSQ